MQFGYSVSEIIVYERIGRWNVIKKGMLNTAIAATNHVRAKVSAVNVY
jgi:hypothetical protein